jgi:hypothetical protein
MALNEMIAQGAQFKMPDPLEQYGRIAQIQQAQNQNALAQYQINSAKRADETNTNFLSSLRAAGDDPVAQRRALVAAGKVKEAADLDVSALTRQETQGRILKQQRENIDRMKLDLGKNPSNENITAYMQDIDADPTFSPAAKAIAKRGFNEMLGMTVDQRKQSLLTSGMSGAEMATAGLAQQKLVAPEPLEIARADGSKIFVDKNPNSPTFKQEILPPQAAGMTPFQTGSLDVSRKNLGVAQGNQRLAQEKFNWEKANPGKTIKEVEQADGTIQIFGIDNRTGIATPVKLAGAPSPAMPGQGRPAVDGGDVALTGKKRPSATAEKAALQRKQLGLDLDRAIIELTDVTKDGGLIDQSTGSGAGRLIDLAAGFGGKATQGAIAIGKLQPIADLALKMVPRFEGPQSDADTTSYKQAAGQLADPTMPTKIRKEAGKTVLRLMKDRKGQFASPEMATEGVAPAPSGNVVDTSNPLLK